MILMKLKKILIVLFISSVFIIPVINSTTANPVPETGVCIPANYSSYENWRTDVPIANLYTNDNTVSGTTDTSTTGYVVLSTFSISTSGTIDGIIVELGEYIYSKSNGTASICVQLSWDAGVTYTDYKYFLVPSSTLATDSKGSSTDDWGHTWNPTELSNANFRLKLVVHSMTIGENVELDYVNLQVFYTIPEMNTSVAALFIVTIAFTIFIKNRKEI